MTRIRSSHFFVVCLFVPFAVCGIVHISQASSGLVYFEEDGGNGNPRGLYNFDAATGVSTLRVAIGGSQRFFGWDVRPSDAKVFSVTFDGGLYTVDISTGQATFIGDTGLGDLVPVGIAFRPGSNDLFVLQNGSANLYSVNPTTAAATLIGANDAEVERGLSFSPSGELFAFQGRGPNLYKLNPTSGAGTLVGGSTPFATIREDSTFTSAGRLFSTDYFGNIYETNPATGAGTFIGSTGMGDGLLGLFYVPEPSTFLQAGLAALGVACFARQSHRRLQNL